MVRAVGGPRIHSNWSASAGQLVFTRDNASVGITWGEDGSGIDTTWYGETAGAKMQWIVSSDALAVTSADVTFTGNDFSMASASITGSLVVAKEADITSASITTIAAVSVNILAAGRFSIGAAGTVSVASAAAFSLADGVNFQLSSASGTQIGTASTQKLGFFGTTPVVQLSHIASATPSAMAEAIATALESIGLFASA